MTNLPTIANKRSPAGLSPLQLYMQEIAKYPLLEPQEEYELAVKHFDGGDIHAAHRLITSNLRLVVKIANDFNRAQANLLDLVQEGNYGLMQAVKRYNPYKGVKLSSYAAWWIRAYILKYIMDNKSQVRIGTTAAQRKLFFNLRKEADKLLQASDHVDTKLLAAALNVRERDVVDMQMRLSSPDLSLDGPIDEDGKRTREDTFADPQESIEDVLSAEEIRELFGEHLREFRKKLSGRDLEVFDTRMLAEEPLTLQQLGDKYGITRERARQIESRIVKKLKEFIVEKGEIDVIDI